MNKKDQYTQIMVESIKNSGMWLKEAKLVSKKGSKGHAQALLIFSIEELGKATFCWLVRIGMVPTNHPNVDLTKKSKHSIFRNHSLKNATALGLLMSIEYPNSIPDDEFNPEIVDPFTNEPRNMHEVLARIGHFASLARMRWMYVDVVDEEGHYKIISPLDKEPMDVNSGIKGMESTLNAFKKIVSVSPLPDDVLDWIEKSRKFLKDNDEYYPTNPLWV